MSSMRVSILLAMCGGMMPTMAVAQFVDESIGELVLPPVAADAAALDEVGVFLRQIGADQFVGRAWGPEQATGPPNTPRAGDFQTAWASLTQDGQQEWLELSYEDAVVPAQMVIHESYNPGAVTRIFAITEDDEAHVVWEGDDPTGVGEERGVSRIKLDTDLKVRRIRVEIDSPQVPGWNEIDAVGMVGQDGVLQWAVDATASTTYADIRGIGQIQPAQVEPQVKDLVRDREKQLAKLIKKLRTTADENQRLRASLEVSQQTNRRLQDENQRLREQIKRER